MAMKTNFPTINLWTTQSSLHSHETWGGVWVVIAISSFMFKVMPTATGKAWYLLRKFASKLSRMEHHHYFLRTCYEEKIIPIGLGMKFNIGLQPYDDMLLKYIAENSLFIFNRIQQIAGDAFTGMNDLFKEFTRIKSDVRRRFPDRIVTQLLKELGHFWLMKEDHLKYEELLN